MPSVRVTLSVFFSASVRVVVGLAVLFSAGVAVVFVVGRLSTGVRVPFTLRSVVLFVFLFSIVALLLFPLRSVELPAVVPRLFSVLRLFVLAFVF